jgi:hypothetical protein
MIGVKTSVHIADSSRMSVDVLIPPLVVMIIPLDPVSARDMMTATTTAGTDAITAIQMKMTNAAQIEVARSFLTLIPGSPSRP